MAKRTNQKYYSLHKKEIIERNKHYAKLHVEKYRQYSRKYAHNLKDLYVKRLIQSKLSLDSPNDVDKNLVEPYRNLIRLKRIIKNAKT